MMLGNVAQQLIKFAENSGDVHRIGCFANVQFHLVGEVGHGDMVPGKDSAVARPFVEAPGNRRRRVHHYGHAVIIPAGKTLGHTLAQARNDGGNV